MFLQFKITINFRFNFNQHSFSAKKFQKKHINIFTHINDLKNHILPRDSADK